MCPFWRVLFGLNTSALIENVVVDDGDKLTWATADAEVDDIDVAGPNGFSGAPIFLVMVIPLDVTDKDMFC